jgi:alpha(1,3/1,4) fucosyltransferase
VRVAFVTERFYRADRLFDPVHRPDAFGLLQQRLNALGHEAHTADVFEERHEQPDLLVYVDARVQRRWRRPRRWRRLPRWLLIIESEVTLPENGSLRRAARFDRVFTWQRSRVDNARTFELRVPYPFATVTPQDGTPPDRFCVLMAANKRFWHRFALYPQRRAAIRWFERNHPDDFDLFGADWDVLVVGGPRIVRALNVLLPRALRRVLAPRFPSHRGAVVDKLETLGRYRFSLCFENAQGLNGYVTEKLFDCFAAGTVPVYWGAPDITELVPAGLIDFREFPSFDALYELLRSLGAEEYRALREAGREFLQSSRARDVFGFEPWLDTLVAHVDGELRGAGPPHLPASTSE